MDHLSCEIFKDVKTSILEKIPSRELTYPHQNGIFEDDFPFPQVGYVNPLEGTILFHILSRVFGVTHAISHMIWVDNFTFTLPKKPWKIPYLQPEVLKQEVEFSRKTPKIGPLYLHLLTFTYIYLHLPTFTYIYLHLPYKIKHSCR